MAGEADILNIARYAIITGTGLAEAIGWVKKALELHPEDQVLFSMLAALSMKANNPTEGLRAAGEAQRLLLRNVKLQDLPGYEAQIQEYSRHRQVYNSIYGNFFSYSVFQENITPFDKRRAFKDSVHYIEFETSSMCNRVCHYCPNALVDRRSHNTIMDGDIFTKVISELAEISYDKLINLSGYNEPLADRGILERIATVRRMLPNVYIRIFSNGDYLTRDYLDELCAAGLNNIQMSIHRQPNEPYSNDVAVDRIKKMAERLGLQSPDINSNPSGTGISALLPYQGLNLNMFQIDYEHYGLDRAGLLDKVGKLPSDRTDACTLPINMFTIHYNGNVMPCCHFVGDNKQHEQYVCGNVKDQSIVDIYSGKALVDWRISLYSSDVKLAPCNSCNRDVGQPFNTSPNIVKPR